MSTAILLYITLLIQSLLLIFLIAIFVPLLHKSGAGSDTDLESVNLSDANLNGADLTRANLERANLIDINLTNTNLTGCQVFGISAWNLSLEGAIQKDLVINDHDGSKITVDNLEVSLSPEQQSKNP